MSDCSRHAFDVPKQDKVRAAFQLNDGEPQVFEGDGLILASVIRTDDGNLSVTPCVQCLNYDETARALMATQVAIWREFVGGHSKTATLTRDTDSIDELWPAYMYKCSACGQTFFGNATKGASRYDDGESSLGFCPICGAKFTETVSVEGGLE